MQLIYYHPSIFEYKSLICWVYQFHDRLFDGGAGGTYIDLKTLVRLPTNWLVIVFQQHKEKFIEVIWEYNKAVDKKQISDYLNIKNLIALKKFYQDLRKTRDPDLQNKLHQWVVARINLPHPNEFKTYLDHVFRIVPMLYFDSCLHYLLCDQDIAARASNEVYDASEKSFILEELSNYLSKQDAEVLKDSIELGRLKSLKNLCAENIRKNLALKQRALQVVPKDLITIVQ